MRIAFGGLGWTPSEFWSSTLTEFFEAIHGFNEANGSVAEDAPPSADEVNDLFAKYGA